MLNIIKYAQRLAYRGLGIAGKWDVQELVYERLFSNFLTRQKIEPSFYPLGKAANFSLMYVIARAFEEFQISNVLELGSGQTTLLLHALRKSYNFDALTIENDPFWAAELSGRVSHQVIQARLEYKTVYGRKTLTYVLDDYLKSQRFDFVIVDGPRGKFFCTHSRWGSLQAIDYLNNDFIIVFDDAERFFESQTVAGAIRLLKRRGIPIETSTIEAAKNQVLVMSKSRIKASFF